MTTSWLAADFTAIVAQARAGKARDFLGSARGPYAVVAEVVWRLASEDVTLVRAPVGEMASWSGVWVDRVRTSSGQVMRVLDDPLGRATPVWEAMTSEIGEGVPPTPEAQYAPNPSDLTKPILESGQVTTTRREVGVGGAFVVSGVERRLLAVNWLAGVSRLRLGGLTAQTTLLTDWVARGATAVRVAATLAGDWWNGGVFPADDDLSLNASLSGYQAGVEAMAELADALGVLLVVTVFGPGALTTPGCASADARETFLRSLLSTLKPYARVILELAYEPASEGWTASELVALLQVVRRVDATRLVAYGAETGTRSGALADARGGSWLAVHPDQSADMTADPWVWVVAQADGFYQPGRAVVPVLLAQPMTAGEGTGLSSRRVDAAPERYHAYGALGTILSWETGFSSVGTLRAQAATDLEASCGDAWLLGGRLPRLPATARKLFRLTETSSTGETPFAALDGATVIVGRHDGVTGRALVLEAPETWQTRLRPGWTAAVTRVFGGTRLLTVTKA